MNWTMHVGKRLDMPPETFDEWGPARYQLAPENVADEVQFRVEEQCVLRLPGSNALLFSIHTYLKSLGEIPDTRSGRKSCTRCSITLPEQVAAYKGLTAYREQVIEYLERCQ